MKAGEIVIVVASAGWVFVGIISAKSTKQHLVLERASSIRQWGTKRGLGELALCGPQKATVLDPTGYVWLEQPTHVLFRIPCDARFWEGKLP